MKLTDEAVEAAARFFAETRSQAWLTFSDETRSGLIASWKPMMRATLEVALPHLTDDGVALPVRRDGEGPLAAAPSSPHLSRDAVMAHYHSQFCEYDGKEDGVEVCAGECREFAEGVGEGATPAIDRATIMLALYEDGAYCGDCDYESAHFTADGITFHCDDCERVLGKYADTMLALIEGVQ